MAVKASAQITLNSVVDIKATYRYYLLQSSTLAKPAVPTTNPPSSAWDDTEPTYTSGSTNSLYYVDLTVFSDDKFSYSAVSLSTSYEAAKEAYNKANNAQNTADSVNNDLKTKYYTITQTDAAINVKGDSILSTVSATYTTKQEVENIEIGGRNLLLGTDKTVTATATEEFTSRQMTRSYSFSQEIAADPKAFLLSVKDSYLSFSYDVEVGEIYSDPALSLNRVGGYFTFNLTNNETGQKTAWYGTHSNCISAGNNTAGYRNSLVNLGTDTRSFSGHYAGYSDMSNLGSTFMDFYQNPDKYTVTGSTAIVEIRGFTKGGTIKNVKLEIGNKPTRWTPAPEDMATAAEFDSLSNKVTTAETNIKQNADSITSVATRTTAVENKFGDYSTTEQMNSAIEQKADSITSTVSATYATKTALDNVSVGGKNILADSDVLYERTNAATAIQGASVSVVSNYDLQSLIGKEVTASLFIHAPGARDTSLSTDTVMQNRFGMHGMCRWRDSTGAKAETVTYPFTALLDRGTTRERVCQTQTLTAPSGYDTLASLSFSIQMYAKPAADNTETWQLGYPKLEVGNKATDWTPAPEDVAGDIAEAQSTADTAASNIAAAETTIQQLADSISSLVRKNGESSMFRQEADGLWYFDITNLDKLASDTATNLGTLDGIVKDANGEIDVLKTTAKALQERTEYVRSYTDENDQPCLELGEGDSVFKVRITNTEIQFAEGTAVPAKLNRKMLVIEKAMVKNELQFGDDEVLDGVWIWKRRENGNLGLSWKTVR